MIFVGGIALLVLVLLLGYGFVNANPAVLARFALWFGIFVALVISVLLIESGRFLPLVVAVGGAAPFLGRARSLWRRWSGGAPAGSAQVSEVETAMLRMSLDHGTGTMTGTVRAGPFQGRRLDELDRAGLIALWRECRAEDPPSATLLETYLDRFMPDWREEVNGRDNASRAQSAGGMTREEALEILGLKQGATEPEIKDAHRRLMMKLHPDQGGSNTLAAQVNRAKDVLLGN